MSIYKFLIIKNVDDREKGRIIETMAKRAINCFNSILPV